MISFKLFCILFNESQEDLYTVIFIFRCVKNTKQRLQRPLHIAVLLQKVDTYLFSAALAAAFLSAEPLRIAGCIVFVISTNIITLHTAFRTKLSKMQTVNVKLVQK